MSMLQQFEFLNLISNLNFHIIYHNEPKYRTPCYVSEVGGWGFSDEVKKYYDFDIEINDYQIQNIVEYIIEKFKKIEYYEYLVSSRESFYQELKSSLKESASRLVYLQNLMNIEQLLGSINSEYETIRLSFNPNYTIREYFTNKRVKIHPNIQEKYSKHDEFTVTVISNFVAQHKTVLEGTLNYIQRQVDLYKQMNNSEFKGKSRSSNDLIWNKNDTALLELITALLETKSVTNSDGDLSRKDAIEIFSHIFNIQIKDAESKISRATGRKKDVSPYLTSLKEAFDNYAIKKEERLDNIRG